MRFIIIYIKCFVLILKATELTKKGIEKKIVNEKL